MNMVASATLGLMVCFLVGLGAVCVMYFQSKRSSRLPDSDSPELRLRAAKECDDTGNGIDTASSLAEHKSV